MNLPGLQIAERVLGTDEVSIHQIKSGNSRVFRASSPGQSVILKMYPQSGLDSRDRMGCEVTAVRFMRSHGVLCVPDVLLVDRVSRAVVFEDAGGKRPLDVNSEQIADAVRFLSHLKILSDSEDSCRLQNASEACVAPEDYVSTIDRRIEAWRHLAAETVLHDEAQQFVLQDLQPALVSFARVWRLSPHYVQLSRTGLTLSPSDFGFHNAVLDEDGRLSYVDFEYFGWDDPAKLICDFVHHPGMSIDRHRRDAFRALATEALDGDGCLSERIGLVHPLVGLKWCLIMLNEFRHDMLAQRVSAGEDTPVIDVLERQLKKAKAQFRSVTDHAFQEVPLCAS